MKTALITGASRGIGAAIAKALSLDGYRVVINYKSNSELAQDIASDCGGISFMADVSNPDEVRRMYDETGAPDVLICNAGISEYGLFSEMGTDTWRRIFSVNLDGVYNCIQAVLPAMIRKKHGVILTISSVWGVHGAACEAAYSASKAAVIGLSKSLAKELGPSGIRVNCLAPGVIDTDMLSGFTTEEKDALVDRTPLCRLGKAEDVAGIARFLCTDEAGFITGQVIGVDGGFGL